MSRRAFRVVTNLTTEEYFKLQAMAGFKGQLYADVIGRAISQLYISEGGSTNKKLIEPEIVTESLQTVPDYQVLTVSELLASRPHLKESTIRHGIRSGRFPVYRAEYGTGSQYQIPISPEFLAWEEKVKAEPRGKGRSKNVNA